MENIHWVCRPSGKKHDLLHWVTLASAGWSGTCTLLEQLTPITARPAAAKLLTLVGQILAGQTGSVQGGNKKDYCSKTSLPAKVLRSESGREGVRVCHVQLNPYTDWFNWGGG